MLFYLSPHWRSRALWRMFEDIWGFNRFARMRIFVQCLLSTSIILGWVIAMLSSYEQSLNVHVQVSALSDPRSSFFVSLKKPHNAVSTKTLSRWTCNLLQAAGVDTDIFKSHATRSAASAMFSRSLSAVEICKLADWSTTSGVFKKFYQRYLWGYSLYSCVVSHTMVLIYMKWMLSKLTMVLINCLGFLPLAWGKTSLCILSIV